MSKVSNTRIDLYNLCGMKYKFRYKDNLKGNYTSTPLLFGIALDNALNYILESMRDKKEWNIERAKEVFVERMNDWTGQNTLEFFKNEVPDELQEIVQPNNPEHQEAIWDHIVKRGLACIDVYIKDVLPQFEEIIEVQTTGSIKNAEEDELVFVVDFIARMKDGRVVLFDNKSSSQRYSKNKVIKSQQLSLYLEAYPHISLAGYCVLIKNPEKERGVTHQILIDEIPEETKQKSFDEVIKVLDNVKAEKFEKNEKSCWSYSKRCEYFFLCKNNDPTGLVPNYEKK